MISKGGGLIWIKRKHYFEPDRKSSLLRELLPGRTQHRWRLNPPARTRTFRDLDRGVQGDHARSAGRTSHSGGKNVRRLRSWLVTSALALLSGRTCGTEQRAKHRATRGWAGSPLDRPVRARCRRGGVVKIAGAASAALTNGGPPRAHQRALHGRFGAVRRGGRPAARRVLSQEAGDSGLIWWTSSIGSEATCRQHILAALPDDGGPEARHCLAFGSADRLPFLADRVRPPGPSGGSPVTGLANHVNAPVALPGDRRDRAEADRGAGRHHT